MTADRALHARALAAATCLTRPCTHRPEEPAMTDTTRAIVLTENTRFGPETGAGILRNRCAFTPRDMGADWPEAFTYAVVMGWEPDEGENVTDAMQEMAARWDWDEPMVEFLRDAHRRFRALGDSR